MAIETRCTNCTTILKIAEQHAGRQARCPHCQTEYTVPAQTDEVALDAVCDFCGDPLDPNASPDDKTKTCAACQASIEENQVEIQAELQSAQHSRGALISIAVLGGGLYLLYRLADVIRDYFNQ
jgi:phage FluMu protein Com